MPVCHDSKKAKKQARRLQAELNRINPGRDILQGITWAVLDEEKKAAIERGWAWGDPNKAMKIVRPSEAQSTPMKSGGWGEGGIVLPDVEATGWADGVGAKSEEEKVTKWVDTTPPKTEEQLMKERVDKALLNWPWKGLPPSLITIVRASPADALLLPWH